MYSQAFLCLLSQSYKFKLSFAYWHAPLLVSMSELAFKESQRKPG